MTVESCAIILVYARYDGSLGGRDVAEDKRSIVFDFDGRMSIIYRV